MTSNPRIQELAERVHHIVSRINSQFLSNEVKSTLYRELSDLHLEAHELKSDKQQKTT